MIEASVINVIIGSYCDLSIVRHFLKKDVFSEIWINIQHFSLTEMNFKIYKYALTSIWILIIRIRQSRDRLIFIMEIPYMERPSLYWDGALASMCEGMFSNAATLQALSSVEVYSDVRTSPSTSFNIFPILLRMEPHHFFLCWLLATPEAVLENNEVRAVQVVALIRQREGAVYCVQTRPEMNYSPAQIRILFTDNDCPRFGALSRLPVLILAMQKGFNLSIPTVWT